MYDQHRHIRLTLLLAAAFTFVSSIGYAIPVTWQLEDVVFDGGGTATGRFTVDVDTQTFSDVSITTTLGTLPGAVYLGDISGASFTASGLEWVRFATASGDLTGEFTFSLLFLQEGTGIVDPLDNDGGVRSLLESESAEVACTSADCNTSSGIRFIETGGKVRSVPEPGTGALLLMGALFALWQRRNSERSGVPKGRSRIAI